MAAARDGGSQDRTRGGEGELTVGPTAGLDPAQVRRLERIYAAAFAPHLRVPLPELATASARDLMLVAVEDNQPVGFAAMRLLDAAGWVFLRYFAIAADRRRGGLGLRFWRRLSPALAAAGWPARIAFEVEDPAEAAGDAGEVAIRCGRIAFWQRCGAVPLPVPGYVMPAMTELGEPEPMVLMAADPAGPAVRGEELTALVLAIFTEHYGLSAEHPQVLVALESIEPGS
jgi:Acetyltransferase (GNAT) family